MTVTDYLLHLFYRIDTELQALHLPPLRQRGPRPVLSDAEVITIELAGEFMSIDTDEGIFAFFRRYHLAEFPALAQINRTTFVRQAANLWRVKQLLHERLLTLLPLRDPVEGQMAWLIDSFPLRICKLARAPRSKLFKGIASYGHDPSTPRDLYYGLRVHLRASDGGFCAAEELTGANTADLLAAPALAPPHDQRWGVSIGDRNYWPKPGQTWRLDDVGMVLLAPFKKKSSDPNPPRSKLLTRIRQIIEPVIGQLAGRFHAERTWARDLWHLCSRLIRKLLSHTAAVLINLQQGNPPLQLDQLLDV